MTDPQFPNHIRDDQAEDDSGAARIAARNVRPQFKNSDILFAFAVGVALYLAYQVRETLLLIYIAALFAVVLMPVIQGIMNLKIGKHSPGRGFAILLLLLAVAGATVLFFAFAIPPVVHDLHDFATELPSRAPRLLREAQKLPFSSGLDVESINRKVQGYASNLAEYVLLSISSWASRVIDILATVVLTVYFMLEGETAYSWLLSLFPRSMQMRLDETLNVAKIRMGKWLLAQALLMLILGISSTIAFALLKIRYAYALGVLMGVLNIVPVVGGMISMVVVVIVAALDSGAKVIGALIFYFIYVQVENSYLIPRIMQTHVDLAGLAVLIALLLGTKLAGVAGATIAVPTAVLVAVLIQEYLVKSEPLVKLAEKS